MVRKKLENIILIDDDDVANFISKKIILKADLSVKTIAFQSVREALGYLNLCASGEEISPDIIFLDLNMPVLNGWAFLEEFKKIAPKLKSMTTVYVLSSSIYKADIERAKGFMEVKDYISKPLTKEKIMEIAQNHTEV